jgi:amidase
MDGETKGALWSWSATQIAKAVRARDISCVEAVESCLSRIDAVNPALNAIVDYFPDEARAAAKRADEAVARGDELGLLHGVPVTFKINADYEGKATTNGVVAYKNVIAPGDAPVVANWKKAGAIAVGRTNVPAFSTRYFSDNDLHGRTLNPWRDDITPGGSSGGAASAVASGMGALAHGNDRAGSIRQPAYCCGIYGLRPSFGRVPAFNPSARFDRPLSSQFTSVQGPLARSIADLRVALTAMCAGDVRDPWWVPAPLYGPGERAGEPKRVALVTGLPDELFAPEVRKAVADAGRWLQEAGYAVDEVKLPMLAEAQKIFYGLVMTEERAAGSQSAIDTLGDERVKRARGDTLSYSTHYDAPGYIAALARRTAMIREFALLMQQYPLVVLPVSWLLPLPIDTDQKGEKAVHAMLDGFRPLVAMSLLGLPSLAAPTGLANGIPVGVQIVASRFREDLCFAAGEVIESRTSVRTPIDPRSGSGRT